MKDLQSLLDKAGDIIGYEAGKVFFSPLFWVIFAVLIGCIVLTYNGSTQNRLSGSLVNTFRQFGLFLLDAFNSIVQAFKSLFGFLDVVRLLFFGRLGNSTLFVLTNYAIIFLSIASFATTMSGLRSLVGWLGILISFGVQVMELIAVMGLIVSTVHAKGRLKETVTYKYHPGALPHPPDLTDEEKAADAQDKDIWQKALDEQGAKAKTARNTRKKKKPLWGKARRRLMRVALAIAYCVSVSFSYFYIFNTIVMPTAAFDDYMGSIRLVYEVTEGYQKDLTAYRSDLVTALREFNTEIMEYANLSERDYSTIDAQLGNLRSRQDALRSQMVTLLTQMDEEEERSGSRESSAYQTLQSAYRTASISYEVAGDEIADLEEITGSSDYILYQAIAELNRYYEDPLYLQTHTSDSVQGYFAIVVANGYMPHSEDISFHLENIRTAFTNYMMLSSYYAEHDTTGLDLTVPIEDDSAGSNVQELLTNRASVMEHYQSLGAAEKNAECASDSYDEEKQDGQPEEKNSTTLSTADNNCQADFESETADGYLNNESARLLLATMAALEDVPVFSTTGAINANQTIPEPSTLDYLSSINRQYRMVTGSVTLQERAFRKLGSPLSHITWFSFLLAVILDGLIILLCFQRSRQYYENVIRNKRQLVSLLFVSPHTEEEVRNNEDGRRVILAGAVLGSLVYVIYSTLFPDVEKRSRVLAFVLVIGAILFFSLLHSLRSVFCRPSDLSDPSKLSPPPFSNERFQEKVYPLFNEHLSRAQFLKRCSVQFPKPILHAKAYAHNERETDAWRLIEDYKYRAFVPKQTYYEELVTHESIGLEYYILDSDIRASGLSFEFAILRSHGLAHHVEAPRNSVPVAIREEKETEHSSEDLVSAYILPEELMRLIYECILLTTVMGSNWEYTMEDDLIDYEQNDTDEDES